MNIRALLGALILGILVLLLGIGLGILLSRGTGAGPAQVENTVIPDAVKLLSSQVVPSVLARGKITEINGRNITLMYQAQTGTIKITDNATISALVVPPPVPVTKNKYISKQAAFEDIKVDDDIEIYVRVLPDGHIEGFSVLILPPQSVVPPAK